MQTFGCWPALSIAPAPRQFEGQEWLPLSRSANLVRVKRYLFLINHITFEGLPKAKTSEKIEAAKIVSR